MPSLLSKILHRKHRSTSRSPERTDDGRSKRASMPPVSRSEANLPQPVRRSMDHTTRRDIVVDPKRPAPPPPSDATVVISRQDDSAHISDCIPVGPPITEEISPLTSPPTAPRSGFSEGPTYPDEMPTPPFAPHPRDGFALQEVKSVEGRRDRPKMSSGQLRQSVEGELGRHSSEQVNRLSTDARSTEGTRYGGDPGHDIAEESGLREASVTRGDATGRRSEDMIRRSEDRPRKSEDWYRISEDLPRKSVEVPPRNSSLALHNLDGATGETLETGRGTGSVTGSSTEGLEKKMEGLSLDQLQSPALKAQRGETVQRVMEGAAERRAARGEFSEQGVYTFSKAGMSDLVGKDDTVDVQTKWLRPIVQEKILPKVHTEYTTIIEQELHHHHVYPKIQPIEDPNPIVLPPLHRIFSPQTGKWHEVEGDDAAIAILGQDVFSNGPKEVRITRRPYSETAEEEHALGPLTKGLEGRDLTEEGFGTGGKGKVVEREGLLGEDLGDWKDVGRDVIFGTKRDQVGDL